MSGDAPCCAVCGTNEGVRPAATTLDGSAAKILHGCIYHAGRIALAVDDVADDLTWLQQTRAARLAARDD